jgi:hypothetical protein
MVIVVITLATALIIKTQGDSFELIKETKQLYSKNRRDDALVLVQAFKGLNEWGNEELVEIEKQLEYGTVEKFKSALWNGVTKGEVYDHYSGLGATIADMCFWGDVRDLWIQLHKYINGQTGHDNLVMMLSGSGIGFTCYPMIDGTNSLVQNTAKYLKSSSKSPSGGLLRQFVSGDLAPIECQKIWEFFKKTTGLCPEPPLSFPTFPTRNI